MDTKRTLKESHFTEPTLDEEISLLGDDDLMDFMNLSSAQTGIDGVVFVSSALGKHGPRVKYFLKPGRRSPSFSVSIENEPRILANSLPDRTMRAAAPRVIDWVKLNRAALLDFWFHGEEWMDEQVTAFKAGLKKVA